ncbi:hypothetical protein UVI_02058010 [Ustilaginoidea virens]|uniref:Uncharacterized protein n=1 Tax=Ustilaginoidea virens TaxID=1159556 RepID=A0A1B5L048_USTVR|nr:hypothetical protein UVI_02058010 [Ustilaginoidea virens]
MPSAASRQAERTRSRLGNSGWAQTAQARAERASKVGEFHKFASARKTVPISPDGGGSSPGWLGSPDGRMMNPIIQACLLACVSGRVRRDDVSISASVSHHVVEAGKQAVRRTIRLDRRAQQADLSDFIHSIGILHALIPAFHVHVCQWSNIARRVAAPAWFFA